MTQTILGGVILGAVPSIRAFGWALMRLEPEGDEVLGLGVLRTRLAAAVVDAPTPAELTKRARMLARLVRVVSQRERLEGIVRSALPLDAAAEDVRAAGLLDALAAELDVPLVDRRRGRPDRRR